MLEDAKDLPLIFRYSRMLEVIEAVDDRALGRRSASIDGWPSGSGPFSVVAIGLLVSSDFGVLGHG